MHRDNPVSRKLLGVAALFLCLPLFLFAFGDPMFGLVAWFRSGAREPAWAGWIVATSIILALVLLVRSANVVRAGGLLAVVLLSQRMLFPAFYQWQDQPMRIILEDTSGVPGIEVLCNEMALGTQPVTLDEADFFRRVPAVDSPPDQLVVGLPRDADGNIRHSGFSEWLRTPLDPFARLRFQDQHALMGFHDDKKFLEVVAKQNLWWRFERDGYVGFGRPGSGSMGGGGWGNVYHLHPDYHFPAADKAALLLLEGLRDSDFRPAPEWSAYVLRHRHLLFRRLATEALDEPRLEPVLDALAKTYYELPDEPTPDDARRVLSRIFDEIESSGGYTIPSIESRVLPRLAPLCPELIVEEFNSHMPHLNGGDRGGTGTGSWNTLFGRGREARQIPLLVALERMHPPELFESLVWLYAKARTRRDQGQQLAMIIAGYRRPEASAIFRAWMHEEGNRDGINAALTRLDLPELEGEFREFIANTGASAVPFVEERIRRGRDLAALAEWIAPLKEPTLTNVQKSRLLARIDDPRAAELLVELAREFPPRMLAETIEWLSRHPRPHCDRYLLESKQHSLRQDPNSTFHGVEHALLANDTPAIREYIAETAKNDRRNWNHLIMYPPEGPLPHLEWLVSTIKAITEPAGKTEACNVLAAIETPAATALLEEWSRDGSRSLSSVAQAALRKAQVRQAAAAKERARLADLLAERISPQDLIEPLAFVWRDGKYVPR